MDAPHVLVTYASRGGGTRQIAQAIAVRLQFSAMLVELETVDRVSDPSPFHAVVLGSAVYFGSWERSALDFVERHARTLRARPLWLFSSGPLDPAHAQSPVDPPRGIDGLAVQLGARQHRTFGGVLSPSTTSMVGAYLADKGLAGDFRDMAAVRDWGDEIAASLAPTTSSA